MAVVNQYKFVGIDNSTTGGALTPLGSGIPAVNETIVIKSILVTSAGTPTVTITNNSITAIKSAQLTANTTTELLTDRKSTRLNSSHSKQPRMPSSA